MAAPTLVLPGQPLYAPTAGATASVQAGKGTYSRDGSQIFSSTVGTFSKEGGTVSVQGKENFSAIPDVNTIVLGIVTRLTRVQAVLSIIAVDGKQCEQDWQGIIRIADIRQTEKDKIKIWDCFRPGDVVRASVISLGDVRSYYLSTASNELGVIFAKHSETGNRMLPVSWQELQDPLTGQKESRKVARPSSA